MLPPIFAPIFAPLEAKIKGRRNLKEIKIFISRCLCMLSRIGHLDMSIQYMLGEKLNSRCWKDRVVACRVLPIINTPLTTDIANKLAYLFYNDWNKQVRVVLCIVSRQSGCYAVFFLAGPGRTRCQFSVFLTVWKVTTKPNPLVVRSK